MFIFDMRYSTVSDKREFLYKRIKPVFRFKEELNKISSDLGYRDLSM